MSDAKWLGIGQIVNEDEAARLLGDVSDMAGSVNACCDVCGDQVTETSECDVHAGSFVCDECWHACYTANDEGVGVSVKCSSCGWESSHGFTIEVVNDLTGVCPVCESGALVFVEIGGVS